MMDQRHAASKHDRLHGSGTSGLVDGGDAHVSQFGVWFETKRTVIIASKSNVTLYRANTTRAFDNNLPERTELPGCASINRTMKRVTNQTVHDGSKIIYRRRFRQIVENNVFKFISRCHFGGTWLFLQFVTDRVLLFQRNGRRYFNLHIRWTPKRKMFSSVTISKTSGLGKTTSDIKIVYYSLNYVEKIFD